MKKNARNRLKRPNMRVLWYFLRQHIGLTFALLMTSLVIGAMGALNVILVYTILNWGLGVAASQANIFTRFTEFIILIMPASDKFIAAALSFLTVSVLFCIFMYLEVVIRSYLITRIMVTTKMAIFKKFVDADYQYFLDHKQGDLIYRAGQAPESLAALYFAITTIISNLILVLSLLWVVLIIAPKATVVMVGLGLGYYVFTQYIGYRHLYFFGTETTKAGQEHNVLLNESITGIRSIKANNFQASWVDNVKIVLRRRYYYYKKTKLWENFPAILLRMLAYLCVGIAAIVIRFTHADNFVAVLPVFGTFAFAILNLLPKLSSLGLYKMRILNSLPAVELVHTTLNEKNRTIIGGSKEFGILKSSIKFENVCFTHKDRKSLFKDMSMTFEKGKMTAIVGESGSGKSTIVHLLLRLFAPNQGRISIDGVDLKSYDISSWLSKVGFVDQDVFIYNATIKENIVFGLENCKDEDIVDSARIANIHDFIMRLPKAYDTLVGDRGVMLSGGEKQRVAIARAVLRKPQIMIFDEATASLDNTSESLVQEAINNSLKDHTVIIIAHRLSTIYSADKIIVIDKGESAEEGTQQELLSKKGLYWRLYNTQKVKPELEKGLYSYESEAK
jgi:ABC-type multidrug transport system fused ATPase/permease subunit